MNVFIETWSAVWPYLSPASRKAPPTHVEVLLYLGQFHAVVHPHHDRDPKTNEFKLAQIAGTDVLVISLGDGMVLKLIAPDFGNGQDHTFTQDEARHNARRGLLCKEMVLSNSSVYVHTGHEDTLTQHTAYFPPNKKDKKGRGN